MQKKMAEVYLKQKRALCAIDRIWNWNPLTCTWLTPSLHGMAELNEILYVQRQFCCAHVLVRMEKIGHAFAIICRKDWHCFFTTACLWICCSGDCLLVLFLWLCPRRFLKSSWAAEEVMKIINRSTVNRLLKNLKILIQQKKGKS